MIGEIWQSADGASYMITARDGGSPERVLLGGQWLVYVELPALGWALVSPP